VLAASDVGVVARVVRGRAPSHKGLSIKDQRGRVVLYSLQMGANMNVSKLVRVSYSTACWWEHVRAWFRGSAGGAPSRRRDHVIHYPWCCGCGVLRAHLLIKWKAVVRARTTSANGVFQRRSRLAGVKVFKDSSRRSTKVAFPKGTGRRRTYALEIGTP
jgi:hypothetical protein